MNQTLKRMIIIIIRYVEFVQHISFSLHSLKVKLFNSILPLFLKREEEGMWRTLFHDTYYARDVR
jgi:hypothetical protein